MKILESDVIPRIIDFRTIGIHGTGTHEIVTPNPDGTYTVLLNARLTYQQQVSAYQHALSHIVNDDFYKCDDVQQIESAAHNMPAKSEPVKHAYITDEHIKKIKKDIRRQRRKIQEELRAEEERRRNFERCLTIKQAEAYDLAKLEYQRLGEL